MGFDRPASGWSTKRPARRGASWVLGLVLVGIGLLFLLQNAGYLVAPSRWWALLFLIPAATSGVAAWNAFERSGFTYSRGIAPALTGFFLFAYLTIMFLFDLPWNIWWPVIFIIVGTSSILARLRS
jgi:hypothetical protein